MRFRGIAPLLSLLAGLWICPTLHAASLEALVMPGPVIEGHADVEDKCESCHAPFSRANQPQLCLECHEDVAADISAGKGFHGLHPDVAAGECSRCHTEHQGRTADITGLVPETFDHSETDFPLDGAHVAQACNACHETGKKFRDAPSTCNGCHEDDDAHRGNLGTECSQCHVTSRWKETHFDHESETGFALLGRHAEQTCSSCHIDQVFENTGSECIDCHQADDVHGGERGEACGDCHTTERWDDSRFDHKAVTGFALEAAHAELECASCHLTGMSLKEPPTDCAGCHSSNDVHKGQRGNDCAQCHNQRSWRIEFDHLAETGFALLGQHGDLACESCHTGPLTDPLPTACEECHADDDPHGATLGACGSCHSPVGWEGELHFDHEFTRFPLVGLHRLATCSQCHLSEVYSDAPMECVECHREEDPHHGNFGDACGDCHNPGGFELWRFDHNTQTSFALDGAHGDLACETCHTAAGGPAHDTSSTCSSCHLGDDIHHGQFGARCERCHTTRSFDDSVRFR